MSGLLRSLVHSIQFELAAVATRTAALDGTPVNMGACEGTAVFELHAAAGGAATCDLKLQESETQGGTYTDVPSGAFTQFTTGASRQQIFHDLNLSTKMWKKVVSAVGGSPSHTYGVTARAFKKDQT